MGKLFDQIDSSLESFIRAQYVFQGPPRIVRLHYFEHLRAQFVDWSSRKGADAGIDGLAGLRWTEPRLDKA